LFYLVSYTPCKKELPWYRDIPGENKLERERKKKPRPQKDGIVGANEV